MMFKGWIKRVHAWWCLKMHRDYHRTELQWPKIKHCTRCGCAHVGIYYGGNQG